MSTPRHHLRSSIREDPVSQIENRLKTRRENEGRRQSDLAQRTNSKSRTGDKPGCSNRRTFRSGPARAPKRTGRRAVSQPKSANPRIQRITEEPQKNWPFSFRRLLSLSPANPPRILCVLCVNSECATEAKRNRHGGWVFLLQFSRVTDSFVFEDFSGVD